MYRGLCVKKKGKNAWKKDKFAPFSSSKKGQKNKIFEAIWCQKSEVNEMQADSPFLSDLAIKFLSDKSKPVTPSGCVQPYFHNLSQREHIFVSVGNKTKADLAFLPKKRTHF